MVCERGGGYFNYQNFWGCVDHLGKFQGDGKGGPKNGGGDGSPKKYGGRRTLDICGGVSYNISQNLRERTKWEAKLF